MELKDLFSVTLAPESGIIIIEENITSHVPKNVSILVLAFYNSFLLYALKPVITFALPELLDQVKMSGCFLIAWLKDQVRIYVPISMYFVCIDI